MWATQSDVVGGPMGHTTKVSFAASSSKCFPKRSFALVLQERQTTDEIRALGRDRKPGVSTY